MSTMSPPGSTGRVILLPAGEEPTARQLLLLTCQHIATLTLPVADPSCRLCDPQVFVTGPPETRCVTCGAVVPTPTAPTTDTQETHP